MDIGLECDCMCAEVFCVKGKVVSVHKQLLHMGGAAV